MIRFRQPAMLVLLPFVASLCAASGADARSLRDTVRTALVNHPAIKSSYKRRLSAAERVKVERGALFPTVNLRGETGWQYSNTPTTRGRATRGARHPYYASLFRNQGEIVVNQLLFDGFLTYNLVAAARAQVAKAGHQVVDTRQSIALQAVAAHIDVVRNRAFVRIARQNVAAHRSILYGIRRQVRAGRLTAADTSQAQSRLAKAVATLRSRIGALREAQVRYESIVGRSSGASLGVPSLAGLRPRYRSMSVREALRIARRKNPKIGIARSEVRFRNKRYRSTRGLFVPKAEFQGTATIGNNIDGLRGRDDTASALLVLTWNLYRGGADTARRQEALANLAVAKYDQANAQRKVREAVRKAYEALKASRSRISPLRARVSANVRVVSAYAKQFAAGRRSLLDRLDVQNDLFLSRAELADVRYTTIYNYFSLVSATGELLEYFGQQRDPKASKYKTKRGFWQRLGG